jgi:transposase
MGKPLPIDWQPIRIAVMTGGLSYEEAAKKFNVKANTIGQKAKREGWKVTDLERAEVERAKALSNAVKESWAERGEQHRHRMFGIATKAIEASSLAAPKNWRDLETADKIARRAAGLEDADAQGRTIVNLALLGDGEPAIVEMRH